MSPDYCEENWSGHDLSSLNHVFHILQVSAKVNVGQGPAFGARGCPLGLPTHPPTHQMGTHGHQMQGPGVRGGFQA